MVGTVKKQMTEKEYRQIPLLSSSNLREFLQNRKKFYKEVILGERVEDEDYSKSLLLGNIAHTLLLEGREAFDSKFYMSICSAPPTGMLLTFVESLYKHTVSAMDENGVITKDFGELCELAYPESGYKITLEAVLKKFVGSEAEMYYKQLREARTQNLCVVCADDLNIAEKIVGIVQNDEFCSSFLAGEGMNELKVEEFSLGELLFKAMLDRVRIDHEAKTIQVVDLKIVFDNQNFYREYYRKRAGWLQIALYQKAVEAAYSQGMLGDVEDYTFLNPCYLVADSSCFYKPLVYQLTEEDMAEAYYGWEENGYTYVGLIPLLEELKWSQETGNWNITKENYENQGIKRLK